MAEQATKSEPKVDNTGDAGCPPIDFNTFVLSLSTSALASLGVVTHPEWGGTQVNLPLAKQTIDLIALLETKTQGNLSGEEERLIGQILSDLRDKYAQAQT